MRGFTQGVQAAYLGPELGNEHNNKYRVDSTGDYGDDIGIAQACLSRWERHG